MRFLQSLYDEVQESTSSNFLKMAEEIFWIPHVMHE